MSLETETLKSKLFDGAEKFKENLFAGKSSEDTPNEKAPVWEDDDDIEAEEAKIKPKNKRFLKNHEQSSKKLKKIIGEPSWVQKQQAESSDDDEGNTYTQMLSTEKSVHLRQEILGFKKERDFNAKEDPQKNTTSILFHPQATVAIASSYNGFVNFYSVDGKKNDKFHSIYFKDFPVTSTGLVSNNEIIIGGIKPCFYIFDIMKSSKPTRVHLQKPVTKLKNFVVSPDLKLFAAHGRFGEIHIFDAKSKELIRTMKQEENVTSLAFSPDSTQIFSHSTENQVSVFDLSTFRQCHRWTDDGCIHGRRITVTENLVATGSSEGIVNIYDKETVFASKYPAPRKAISNLTTQITDLTFNATREILAFSSSDVTNAVKLVHLPSATVFANFPGNNIKLGDPTVLNFSPQSGFLAVGNKGSNISLFKLNHFGNY